jgi:putative SOS response-associated peptidase YedK
MIADVGDVQSFTVITQPAGSPLNAYYDRAPVVVPREHWDTWLDVSADVGFLLGPESAGGFLIEQASA